MLQLISLLVENKPGALMRVTGVLSARGYNIESLTVARTLDPELSRMTIVAEVESAMRPLLIKQIQIFRARVVDASPGVYTLEATGASEKLDAFIEMLRTYGEIEVVRSGAMALPRSSKENKRSSLKGKDLKKVSV